MSSINMTFRSARFRKGDSRRDYFGPRVQAVDVQKADGTWSTAYRDSNGKWMWRVFESGLGGELAMDWLQSAIESEFERIIAKEVLK